jgi:hypothetical protein
MNSRELASLNDWDEKELEELVARFVRVFHRLPKHDELITFHRTRASLHLRLPAQGRRMPRAG